MVPSRGQRVTVWERPLIKREASDKYGEASYKEREADEWGDGREAGVRLQAAGKLPGSRPPSNTSLPSILRCYISQSSGYRNDRHRYQYQRGHLVGARLPSNTSLPSTTTYLNLIVTISYKHNHKYKSPHNCLGRGHQATHPSLHNLSFSINLSFSLFLSHSPFHYLQSLIDTC